MKFKSVNFAQGIRQVRPPRIGMELLDFMIFCIIACWKISYDVLENILLHVGKYSYLIYNF